MTGLIDVVLSIGEIETLAVECKRLTITMCPYARESCGVPTFCGVPDVCYTNELFPPFTINTVAITEFSVRKNYQCIPFHLYSVKCIGHCRFEIIISIKESGDYVLCANSTSKTIHIRD